MEQEKEESSKNIVFVSFGRLMFLVGIIVASPIALLGLAVISIGLMMVLLGSVILGVAFMVMLIFAGTSPKTIIEGIGKKTLQQRDKIIQEELDKRKSAFKGLPKEELERRAEYERATGKVLPLHIPGEGKINNDKS